ncbi:TetR family transcriptional regulator [Sphingomonas sp. MAH-20]|uniref:TetR family transcriptional regulator n=1 Tax=Sphingomonas horti TaxID=2682842 RepID=A0A6I4J5P7_9SPHN|nr:TetR/AcrR family transcriptional regulator [Sphingomonas sp. CGMCC 1.13658]MBA2921011.1 TetR/AcrR family transcriptional regulator [Sphingomonas sp. CGMCC 1.13658]MVO79524.1 TetR family transcriptional regulator [Sphingomonas horti]
MKARTTSRPLTRDDWLTMARKALVDEGVDGVKVDRLARRMKVTRGSFYYHFSNRQDLLDALLRDWEVRNLVEIAQVRDRWALAEPDLSEVVAIWLGEDPGFLSFDMAIRMWARKSPKAASIVYRVDDAWIALLTELFRISGYSDKECLVRARITYFHQIGYYALNVKEDFAQRLQLVPIYYNALTGKEPTAALDSVLSGLKRRRATSRSRTG